jgi:2-polyprenyl-6-methoxyphenol hydroxylase-like FAD-dependent oxidoreductase
MRQALVIGSGMSGLFAARVLADHFEQVTILDRDTLTDSLEARPGVPQGRHVHGLLLRGLRILEQLFPGISSELEAAGAQRIDWINDLAFHTVYGVLPRFTSEYQVLTCSRPLLEATARRRLTAHPRVRFLARCEATGLLSDPEKNRVTGVRLRARDPEAHALGAEEELAADLVVDASGRDSHVLDWLAALGYEQPPVETIDGKLGYATRYYRRPQPSQADWKVLALLNSWPQIRRGGIVMPIEGDRWIVTVAGIGDDHPPTDEAGFLAFLEGMTTPLLAEAVRQAEPVSTIYGFQRMENRWRHFERLARWPEGFLAVGDAVCQLNPYYGQGMAVAALTALTLDKTLRESAGDQPALARRFQKALAKVFAAPWLMATSEDLRSPFTEGGASGGAASRVMYGYFDGVKRAIAHDKSALRIFVEVTHLLKPASAMFHPAMVTAVLRQSVGTRSGR